MRAMAASRDNVIARMAPALAIASLQRQADGMLMPSSYDPNGKIAIQRNSILDLLDEFRNIPIQVVDFEALMGERFKKAGVAHDPLASIPFHLATAFRKVFSQARYFYAWDRMPLGYAENENPFGEAAPDTPDSMSLLLLQTLQQREGPQGPLKKPVLKKECGYGFLKNPNVYSCRKAKTLSGLDDPQTRKDARAAVVLIRDQLAWLKRMMEQMPGLIQIGEDDQGNQIALWEDGTRTFNITQAQRQLEALGKKFPDAVTSRKGNQLHIDLPMLKP